MIALTMFTIHMGVSSDFANDCNSERGFVSISIVIFVKSSLDRSMLPSNLAISFSWFYSEGLRPLFLGWLVEEITLDMFIFTSHNA